MAGTLCSPACSTALEPPSAWSLECWSPLSLQLLLQCIEEAPVGALGHELLWGRLDHPDFVQAQGVEADRVLGAVAAPLPIGQLPHGLGGVLVVCRNAALDERTGHALGLQRADVGRLEDGAQRTLGRDWVSPSELPVGDDHAAEVLGPRPV